MLQYKLCFVAPGDPYLLNGFEDVQNLLCKEKQQPTGFRNNIFKTGSKIYIPDIWICFFTFEETVSF